MTVQGGGAVWLTAMALLLSSGNSVLAVPPAAAGSPTPLPGIQEAVRVTRDAEGVAHIKAGNAHDLYYMAGRVHAEDRLFQMDTLRRLASGTLAELLGSGALPTDVQLRTLGLWRAVERTWPVLLPETRAALEAYAGGVNSWVAEHPLPPEYAALEITQFRPWTPLDSVGVAKLIAFNRSFTLDIEPTVTLMTYQQAGQALGFNGAALFMEDLWRIEPFDHTATLLDASVRAGQATAKSPGVPRRTEAAGHNLHPRAVELANEYLRELKKLPAFEPILQRKKRPGSNEIGVSGALSTTGHALMANDTHLALNAPSTFYPIHLQAGSVNVIGESFAGVPFVILGHNQFITWGGATFYVDVTDTFQEQIAPDPKSPSGLSTVYQGQIEPIIPIPEVYRMNVIGDGHLDTLVVVPSGGDIPAFTLVVPRRNNGPIVKIDPATGIALSVQYTGFSPTREIDTFLVWSTAQDLDDFRRGLEFFDSGGLNFAYADVRGNIAYFSSSEVPVREDLQAGTVSGLPPWFIRNGTGGNEWLPVRHPQPNQAIPFEILPVEEMPQIINPPAGWFVNCNNDPTGATFDNDALNQLRPGGGLFYLAAYFDSYRAARLTQIVRAKLGNGARLSPADLKAIQADTVMLDAQAFVPCIAAAWLRAQSSAEPGLAAFTGDSKLAEAVGRLAQWDGSTPTGIPEGYDATDTAGMLYPPTTAEIASSVAATIYSLWRGQFIRLTLDAPLVPFGLPTTDDEHALPALRHLLENFNANAGVGASGVNFFNVPGVTSAQDRRDILILQSLANALTRCASPDFAPAFGGSSSLDDYRWGRLHRVVFSHMIGGPFNVPPALGLWPSPLPGLEGIPTDGGFGSLDQAFNELRADGANDFGFTVGPAMRFVSEAGPGWVSAVTSLPGGVSGVPGSPFYLNALSGYLANDTFPLRFRQKEIQTGASSVTKWVPQE
jgi:penicillin amidase